MGYYFITADAADEITAVLAKATTDDIKAAESFECAESVHAVDGDTAIINIKGPMFPTRNRLLSFLGVQHAAYDEIGKQIRAVQDSGAKKAIFAMDTPGGAESGLYAMMDTVANMSIPTETHVTGIAASAGYFVASQTGAIIASNPANVVGSVGLVQTISGASDSVQITNPESPNKRIDATTPEGKAEAQKPLSDLYAIYAEKIAEGRGRTVQDVNDNYGKGAVMSARSALKARMIDAIGFESTDNNKTTAGVPAKNRSDKMDRTQLKADHPELFASILLEGKEAG
ncbi:MAG: S49 family peptidase, partial [Planctomycetota bacterium]